MKNSRKRQVLLAAGTVMVQSAIVESLKKVVPERRPFPSLRKDSFPSGHTATSFAGAEMLRQETQEISPFISYSGYAIAIITGIMRIKERKHWLRDVLAGAAIGIASTQLTYRVNKKLFTGNAKS